MGQFTCRAPSVADLGIPGPDCSYIAMELWPQGQRCGTIWSSCGARSMSCSERPCWSFQAATLRDTRNTVHRRRMHFSRPSSVRGWPIRDQMSAATCLGNRSSPAKAAARLSTPEGILLFNTSTAVNACPRSSKRWHSSCAAVTRVAPLLRTSCFPASRTLEAFKSTAGPCLGPHTASPSKPGISTGRV
jgi:hypothetical protein